jgi:hypothetical protein
VVITTRVARSGEIFPFGGFEPWAFTKIAIEALQNWATFSGKKLINQF